MIDVMYICRTVRDSRQTVGRFIPTHLHSGFVATRARTAALVRLERVFHVHNIDPYLERTFPSV